MADRGRSRGVSESLGFIFVFGIIVVTVGTVYATGFNGLDEAREFERANNAERAFDVLKANVEDISKRGAPSRATEVKLADANLRTGPPATVTVNVTDSSNPSDSSELVVDVVPMIYETDSGQQIIYANGGLFRRSGSGVVMKQQPAFVLSEERVVLPIVHSRTRGGNLSVEGSTTVLIRADHRTSNVNVARSESTYDVTVNVTSSRAGAWGRYFQQEGLSCPVQTDTDVSCELSNVDRVHVSTTRIVWDFE